MSSGSRAQGPISSQLPSYPPTELSDDEAYDDDDDESARIQEELQESFRQMEMMLSIFIIPYIGKWWGRRWAFWGESTWRCLADGSLREVSDSGHRKSLLWLDCVMCITQHGQ